MSSEQKIIGGIGLATLILLIGGVWFLSAQGTKESEKLSKPLLGKEIPILESPHVTGTDHEAYNSDPPTSGPMWSGTAGPGIKNEQVADELLVHSMEHGAVVVHYQADLPESDIEKITNIFTEASGKKIMVPRKNLDVPITLTSWGRLLKLETIDAEQIKEFLETNSDRAPEKMAI